MSDAEEAVAKLRAKLDVVRWLAHVRSDATNTSTADWQQFMREIETEATFGVETEVLEDGPMTVHELIAHLRTFNPDLPVYVEGCDCFLPAAGAERILEPPDARTFEGVTMPSVIIRSKYGTLRSDRGDYHLDAR